MRQKRAKAYRKLMALYCMTFKFRQPYQILVDSEMCKIAIESKLELSKQLGAVLQGDIKPMITQCCVEELYRQGKAFQPAVDLAKSFERRKCNHREPIPGDECLTSVVGDENKNRYVIATQSQPLRVKLRTIPAVPIVHMNRSVMILEPPSQATLAKKESTEESALHSEVVHSSLDSSTTQEQPRKKKGPKGPNPLSMKKKKVTIDSPKASAAKGQAKRKREPTDDGNDEQVTRNDPTEEEQLVHPKRKRRRRKPTTLT
ncbi:Fcf1-domain-containing protein [Hygrophoropsis aurantiaca]|uniref:Fcf1-domain-containing protein n=1 Tax=Hygrophoropsis aurantiaca TaxID=72124 RepID=A0ACB8APU2_9AGAM|nr:Fcf1-domain-containing protein [Hygrophoropsis aurantiaca]